MMELNDKELIKTLVDKYGVHKTLAHYVNHLQKASSSLDAMARDNNPTAMATQVSGILEATKCLQFIVGDFENVKDINKIKLQ